MVDDTGYPKKGNKSVGVQRQYSGTLGKVDNCQIGVILAYISSKGKALVDGELYLPRQWTVDRKRRKEAGIPADVKFRTRPEDCLGNDKSGGRWPRECALGDL